MTDGPTAPVRRPPPRFRRCEVAASAARTASMVRLTLAGPDLVGLEQGGPGASVRLLLPREDGRLELPTWNGNEFLWEDGSRARIRTLTPLAVRDAGDAAELDLDVVLHDDSPLTRWARGVAAGDPVAVSGTGSGYEILPDDSDYVLLGDESAIPAITTLLEALPATAEVVVYVERRSTAEAVLLPDHPGATVTWSVLPDAAPPGDTLVAVASMVELGGSTRIWAAGEAASVQRIRKVLFARRGVPRDRATVRGYWKVGRAGT